MAKIILHDPKNRLNLVWVTDLHFSAVPPGRRKDNYEGALFDKLEFVRSLTKRLHAACLVGGDVFHIKHPKAPGNSLSMIERLIRTFSSFPEEKVWGAIGNHDISFDRMDTLPKQPLGILIAAGVYHNLVTDPVVFTNTDETVKVSVEAFPYAEGEATIRNIMSAPPRLPSITQRIGIVHAYGHPGGAAAMFGTRTIGYNELDGSDFDLLLWGHDHSRHGVEDVGQTTHINLGSMARAAFQYDELDRPVVAAVLSFQPDGSFQYGEKAIPVKPLEVAFAAADKGMEAVHQSEDITHFFAEMDEAVGDIEVNDPSVVIKQLCAGDVKLENLILELCNLTLMM